MAREIVISVLCDACLRHEIRTEATELPPLSLAPTRKPRVLALCDPCKKELYEPLLLLLAERGAPVADDGTAPLPTLVPTEASGKGRPPIESPCPACAHVSISRGALKSHVRQVHGTTLDELNGEETPYPCPICGRGFTRPQGLSTHRRIVHDDTPSTREAAAEEAEE